MSDEFDEDDAPDLGPEPPPGGNLARGVDAIRAILKTLPPAPGVYRMLDAKGNALYVGKAAHLKNRVANYTNLAGLPVRLKRMVAETRALEIAITHTEVEALLLECNLIKRLMPRYNVLLRDDKSFPYIHLSGGHPFPQLGKHRGSRGDKGDYFGPFASAGAVNRTLIALQRAFLLRSCSDSIIALHQAGGQSSLQVFFFRGGQNWGNRAYFPSHAQNLEAAEIMGAFLGQFYANKPPPPQILLSHRPAEADLIAAALSERAARRHRELDLARGDKKKLVAHALLNAREALGRRLAESSAQRKLLEGVAQAFGLDGTPQRIEVYDNSHIQGAHAVGAMIVAGPEGLLKSAYRKFTIREQIAPGDDFAMMSEVLGRRFARALKENPDRSGFPDLVMIDGGAGQLSAACQVLVDLGLGDLPLVAVGAFGDRNAGRERFFRPGKPPLSLEPRDPILYFLQRLRDEAHRFAIGAHRAKRTKAIGLSLLDEIPGIGARRKKALLHHFGSAREVAAAGQTDLERVDGISRIVAKKIYDHFHAEG